MIRLPLAVVLAVTGVLLFSGCTAADYILRRECVVTRTASDLHLEITVHSRVTILSVDGPLRRRVTHYEITLHGNGEPVRGGFLYTLGQNLSVERVGASEVGTALVSTNRRKVRLEFFWVSPRDGSRSPQEVLNATYDLPPAVEG